MSQPTAVFRHGEQSTLLAAYVLLYLLLSCYFTLICFSCFLQLLYSLLYLLLYPQLLPSGKTSRGLKPLVYEGLSYSCMRP